jgi:GTPase SAR1 family protein
MQTGTYPSPTKWSAPNFESVDLDPQPSARKISKIKINLEPTGPPERTFRVVMAGDASVGKSSFIMRLCRGEFIPNLPSTLGVDFHVRTLNVDGKNVAIQVWDTAGQVLEKKFEKI